MISLGRRYRTIGDDFLEGGTIPAWLTAGGTYTWEQQSAAGGWARVTSAATVGALAVLKSLRGFSMIQARALAVTCQGLKASSAAPQTIAIMLANDARTGGVLFQHRAGQATAEFVLFNDATTTTIPVPYLWSGSSGRANAARNFTLMYSKVDNCATLLSDGAVIAIVDTTGLVANKSDLRPGVFIEAPTAVATHVYVESFKIETWA